MTQSSASISPFAVFKNRNFFLMWTGQLISTMGSALTYLAASIYVYRLTGSALSVGLMLMATAAPSLVVGLFAGVIVDRYDRRKIMVASDIARGVLIALIPILVSLNILWLYVIIMLTSAIQQFFDPAFESVLPEVASDEELAASNSLISISSFGSNAVGFAAAGLIASAASIDWAFYLDAVSFAISAACIYFIHVKHIEAEDETSAAVVLKNLRAGMQQLFGSPMLRSLYYLLIVYFIATGFSNALLLPFALKALKATEFEYGLQEGLTSIGFVLASLYLARAFDRLQSGAWLAISFLGMGIAGVLYSGAHSIPLAIGLITITGIFNAPYAIARRVIVQRNTPTEMLGRVLSVMFVSRDVLGLISMGAVGLADIFDVRLLFLISSVLWVIPGLAVLFIPELGPSWAEWRRTFSLLRGVEAAPRLGAGRPATLSEMDRLIGHMPQLAGMSQKEKAQLASDTLVAEAKPGQLITYRGEQSDAAYLILKGSVGVGHLKDNEYNILNYLHEGDFFGEVAALTGMTRTANVLTEEDCEFLIIPAKVLKRLARNYPELNIMLHTAIGQRLSLTELPHTAGIDQQLLRDLRTVQPDTKTQSASA